MTSLAYFAPRVARGALVSLLATIAGCGSDSSTFRNVTGNTEVATVRVTPTSASVDIGGTITFEATAYTSDGAAIAGKAMSWSSSSNTVASVSAAGAVTGVAAGGATISASVDGKTGSASVTVVPVSASTGTITVNGALRYQTMTGWEALAEIGQSECDPRAYQSYKNGVLDRAANELGINRIRIALRNGYENPVDYFADFQAGRLTFNQWQTYWFKVVNDNSDPFVMNPAGFNWGYLDYTIDELVVPLKQRLAARGEGFWLNLSYTGANSGNLHRDNPDEYAEIVLAAFQHLQARYGWVPNSLEIINEPNLGTWNGTQVGQAMVAAKARLAAAGFFPQFVGPTVSQVTPSLPFFDEMMLVPGAAQALNEFSYHRYNSKPTDNQLREHRPARDDSTGSARRCWSTAGVAMKTCTTTLRWPTCRRGNSSASPSAATATSAGTTSPSTAPRSATTPRACAPGK